MDCVDGLVRSKLPLWVVHNLGECRGVLNDVGGDSRVGKVGREGLGGRTGSLRLLGKGRHAQ